MAPRLRAAPRTTIDPSRDEAHVRTGYFGVDSGNDRLDHVIVGVLGAAGAALVGSIVFAGNPFAIVGLGAATFAVLYSA